MMRWSSHGNCLSALPLLSNEKPLAEADHLWSKIFSVFSRVAASYSGEGELNIQAGTPAGPSIIIARK